MIRIILNIDMFSDFVRKLTTALFTFKFFAQECIYRPRWEFEALFVSESFFLPGLSTYKDKVLCIELKNNIWYKFWRFIFISDSRLVVLMTAKNFHLSTVVCLMWNSSSFKTFQNFSERFDKKEPTISLCALYKKEFAYYITRTISVFFLYKFLYLVVLEHKKRLRLSCFKMRSIFFFKKKEMASFVVYKFENRNKSL